MSDWKRLRGIVEEALGVPAVERGAWLDGACNGDAALRARAQKLLDASLTEDAFLRAPTAPADGDRIGPYTLVRRIATGGMGTVYLAERERPHRRVALKLMRTGLIGPEAVARFRYEVDVLAALQHPHIAAMYETGFHEELPWFAMEFIEDARTIVAHAKEQQLDVGARLALFGAVCDAVHHGHTKGVLHRDLKPDNLLVGGDGRCRVIDFGVARATDADLELTTLLTSTGEIVGTLAYMSPEQVSGERTAIDTRSDVYALGVVLYELLTGALPHAVKGKTFFDAMSAIRDVAPTRPGVLRTELRGDLETIVLKCLAKEPDHRYASAAALAEDLRRYRAHEPITARAPSVAYQLRTFARRHRVLVGAAAAVLVVSVAAAVVSAKWAADAGEAREGMRGERDKAQMLFTTLLDRSVDTTHEHAMRVQDLAGGAEPAVRMVQDAIADLEALVVIEPRDRTLRLRLINAYLRLGQLRGDPAVVTSEGRLERSAKAYGTALDQVRALHAEDPEDDEAAHVLGKAMTLVARTKKDEALFGEGVVLLEQIERKGDAVDPAVRFELLRSLGYAQQTLGAWCLEKRDLASGREHMVRQQTYLSEVARRWPEHAHARFDLARCRSSLAGLEAASGAVGKAATGFKAALEEFEALAAEDPENQMFSANVAWNALQLGRCRSEQQEFEAAEEHLRHAIARWTSLAKANAKSVSNAANLCTAHFVLGNVALERSKRAKDRRALLAAARDAYREALRLGRAMKRPPIPVRVLEARVQRVDRILSRG